MSRTTVILASTAAVGMLIAPLVGLMLAGAISFAPSAALVVAAGMGALAAVLMSRSPRVRAVFEQIRAAKPDAELTERWNELSVTEQTVKQRRLRWRRDKGGSETEDSQETVQVERSGPVWMYQAVKLLLGTAWRSNRTLTAVAVALFIWVALAPLTGVPVLMMFGQSAGLYLMTALLFTGITFLTDPDR